MIRYGLKIPAVVVHTERGLVDVQLKPGIKITLTEEEFSRAFKVLKDISTVGDILT